MKTWTSLALWHCCHRKGQNDFISLYKLVHNVCKKKPFKTSIESFNLSTRLMFWTEIGNVVKIERAGMDGSERKAVVNSSLGWPGGVAVDTISDRVYWTDERLRAIGSATLDGDDIQVKYFAKGMLSV